MYINKSWVVVSLRVYFGILVTIFLFSCSKAYAESYIDSFLNTITTFNIN